MTFKLNFQLSMLFHLRAFPVPINKAYTAARQ